MEMWSTGPDSNLSPGGLTRVKWRCGSGETWSIDLHPDLSPGDLAEGYMETWSTDPHPDFRPGGLMGTWFGDAGRRPPIYREQAP